MNEALSASSANQKAAAPKKRGLFARIALFFRQVLSELKKVQRPTRQELGQMFVTVIVFVVAIMVFVALLDAAFGRLTLWIFG